METFILSSIILIIILIVLACILLKKKRDNFQWNTDKSLGNCFSRYFGSMGLTFLQGKDFYAESSFKKDPYLQKLPLYIPFQASIQVQLINSGFQKKDISVIPNSYWVVENERAEKFWLIMRPFVHKILKDLFIAHDIQVPINIPVIHFRCSDVPFIRNVHYHFVRYAFYKDCLELAENRLQKKFDSVLLLSCNIHRSNPVYQQKCNLYEASLIQYLRNINYKVNLQCNSNIHDFAALFFAPVVLSPSSSFSFMSGFFGHGLFYSEGHFTEGKGYKLENKLGDWLKTGYSIPHSKVDDYENTEKVIEMLLE